MSHSEVTGICCLVVKCWEDKLNISVYWISSSMRWSALRDESDSMLQPWAKSDGCHLLRAQPISWGHSIGGQVSVEVSHQNSQFQEEQVWSNASWTCTNRAKNSSVLDGRYLKNWARPRPTVLVVCDAVCCEISSLLLKTTVDGLCLKSGAVIGDLFTFYSKCPFFTCDVIRLYHLLTPCVMSDLPSEARNSSSSSALECLWDHFF